MTGSTILQICQPSFRDDGPGWINNTKNLLRKLFTYFVKTSDFHWFW